MRKYNTNPIIKLIAVKADCVFETPALIGNGFGEYTDSDILRDSEDNAFLPGSTIAGSLLSLSSEFDVFKEQDNISPLWVYDADLASADGKTAKIIELDGVALDKLNKVALDKAKYDYEAIDAGTKFTLRFLLTIREKDKNKSYEGILLKLMGALKSGETSFGAKTRRGFGRVLCEKPLEKVFDFSNHNKTALDDWLNFNWRSGNGWKDAGARDYSGDYETLTAKFNIDGSLMVRDMRNIFDFDGVSGETPDYAHISVGGKAAILGTSWAGAFKSGLYRLLIQRSSTKQVDAYLNEVFGHVTEPQKDKSAICTTSKVTFGVSYLAKNNAETDGYRTITRVKIDRFTGGSANGALFTETPWFGGNATLEVRYPNDREDIRELLLLGFDALSRGLMQIGGETAAGRGFVKNLVVSDKSGNIET
ncbi:MAG: RAMP superfamily CRISPR-associated protein [Clostridiales bacterium]|jgi:CRISPR/Cas system CSM-associated protein Csm3 (group 7 of RAMP superfamily)|nr:RAMP superfamily CRISPR-associated protein [Clostridiales bacterium]